MKLFFGDSAHWYAPDGTAFHTVMGKNGLPRATTLRDARKLGLLPSVTNILGILAKPELTNWLQTQAVMAALTLPRGDGESLDAFAVRVVVDAESTRDKAAEFGTDFHLGAERIASGASPLADEPLWPWLTLYRLWMNDRVKRVHWTERRLVNLRGGYAGTADLLIDHCAHGLCMVDLKTQGVKEGDKGRAYSSWGYQLAAYRAALGQPVACLNLIVNSQTPGEPVEHLWTEDELVSGLVAFNALAEVWSIEKKYKPGNGWGKAEG